MADSGIVVSPLAHSSTLRLSDTVIGDVASSMAKVRWAICEKNDTIRTNERHEGLSSVSLPREGDL